MMKATAELRDNCRFERDRGIEPLSLPWEGSV